jgi:CreA protein
MRMLALCSVLIAAPAMAAEEPTRVGDVSTTFRLVGRNQKFVVDRYNDLKAPSVSCYVSRAETAASRARSGSRPSRSAGIAAREHPRPRLLPLRGDPMLTHP